MNDLTKTKQDNLADNEGIDFVPTKVFEKILLVMEAIPAIEKDGFNDFAGYNYASIDGIMKTLQPELVKQRLAMIPDVLEEHQNGNMATVSLLVTFINVEDADDRFTTRWTGTGTDKADKALPKAITAAFKQCVLKTFCIGAGEVDPDSQSEERAVRTLSDEQQRTIFEALAEKGLDVQPVLESVGVTSIHDIPAHQYNRITQQIAKAKSK